MSEYFNENLENPEDFCDYCDGKGESACCGAPIIAEDICSDCREHCDNRCSDCEFNMDNIKKYSCQRIYGD